MHMIVKLRDHLMEKGAAITSRSPWMPALAFAYSGIHTMKADEEGMEAGWRSDSITDISSTMQAQKKLLDDIAKNPSWKWSWSET